VVPYVQTELVYRHPTTCMNILFCRMCTCSCVCVCVCVCMCVFACLFKDAFSLTHTNIGSNVRVISK
jgi:hypothetical protein